MKYTVQLVRAEGISPDDLAEKTGEWIQALARSYGEPVSFIAVSAMEGQLGKMTLHTMVLFKSN